MPFFAHLPLLLLHLVVLATSSLPQPVPPQQTPFQRALVARANAAAAPASAAATPALIALLDAAPFRASLRRCCGEALAAEPAASLLVRLRREALAAELTHNFNANSSGTWEGDVNVTVASELPYLPNLWTLMYQNLTARVSQREEDLAEVGIMGFKPFSTPDPVGSAQPPSFAEAAERPLYVAHNMLGLSVGNPTFGDVSIVLKPSFAQPMALVEPVRTAVGGFGPVRATNTHCVSALYATSYSQHTPVYSVCHAYM